MSTFERRAAAADGGTLLLVLDVSGSMKGPSGSGTDKMTAAKRAMNRVVDGLPADTVVGLRLYGSTIPDGPGSCTDSQLVVPPAPLDSARLKSEVAKLRALGNTPIAHSLRQAGKDLPREGARSIVLVSDGEETCGGNPCSVAEELTRQGIDLRIDVIGFRVDPKARDQLTCIAQAGRGTYFDAQDAESLSAQLNRLSSRAARAYRPQGTPVRGTPAPADAPRIDAGQYVDLIGGSVKGRHYGLDYAAGATIHVSATIQPSATTSTRPERITVSVLSAAGESCLRQTEASISGFENRTPLSATVSFPRKDTPPDCKTPGGYTLRVERERGEDVKPLELVVIEEPPVTSTSGLPPPVPANEDYDVPARATGAAKTAVGSPNFTDAPVLTPGVWRDTILPNEVLLYRVDLDWGQQLACDVSVPASGAFSARRRNEGVAAPIKLYSFGPTRLNLYSAAFTGADTQLYNGSAAVSLHRSTPPVRYRNREQFVADARGTTLPGAYYCGVLVNAHNTLRGPVELPLTLKVDVVGTAGAGAPTYQQVGGVSTPSAGAPTAPAGSGDGQAGGSGSAGGDGGTPSWLWALAGVPVAVVLLGAVLLRRRRTTEEGVIQS